MGNVVDLVGGRNGFGFVHYFVLYIFYVWISRSVRCRGLSIDRAGIFINDIYMSCGSGRVGGEGEGEGGWVGRRRMKLGRVVLADNDTVGMYEW